MTIEPIDLNDWKKRVNKLNKKYKSYLKLKEDCIKKIGVEYFVLTDATSEIVNNVIMVAPSEVNEGGRDNDRVHSMRDLPMYSCDRDDGSLKLFDTEAMIDEIIPLLKDHIDVEMLVKDTLQDQSLEMLIEIKARLFGKKDETQKKASVKQKPGCLYLSIGGRPGKPLDLFLRE